MIRHFRFRTKLHKDTSKISNYEILEQVYD